MNGPSSKATKGGAMLAEETAAHVAKTGNIKKCEDEMVSLAFPTSWGVARKLFPLSRIE